MKMVDHGFRDLSILYDLLILNTPKGLGATHDGHPCCVQPRTSLFSLFGYLVKPTIEPPDFAKRPTLIRPDRASVVLFSLSSRFGFVNGYGTTQLSFQPFVGRRVDAGQNQCHSGRMPPAAVVS